MQVLWNTASRSRIRYRACQSALHPPAVSTNIDPSWSYLCAHGESWIQNDPVRSLFGTRNDELSISKDGLKPLETIDSCSTTALPTIDDLSSGSDVCFIYLTSGSTSGSPKIVPLTQKFVSIYYKTQFGIWLAGRRFDTQDVFLSRSSICAVATMIQYLGCLYTGSCIVQPSKRRFSTEELSNMVNVCGLNRMTTFGTWLAPHIQAAKKDPVVLKLLQVMRTVSYGGVPISIANDDWCFQNGIPLTDMYATTECGLLMTSVPGKPARFMRPVSGLSCRFDPLMDTTGVDDPASTQLLKFILLADSPQIPQPHLLSIDGNFHTGDLFEKQVDGSYLFRGRADDWIKTDDASITDTKAIEEKIYDMCSDLVKECIVVGHLRPSPTVFIEVHHDNLSTMSEDGLEELLLQRLEDFNARQYTHERIIDKRLIFIVDEGILPRTVCCLSIFNLCR
ncbi:hypothetical protein JOM56_005028 [Amanita muscaria]